MFHAKDEEDEKNIIVIVWIVEKSVIYLHSIKFVFQREQKSKIISTYRNCDYDYPPFLVFYLMCAIIDHSTSTS